MKTKVIVIIFTLSICSNIYAQLNNSIVINNVVARQTGNMLAVEMVINGEKAGLSSAEKVVLTPVVKSGERILELPSVTISGNKRYKADKRVLYFFNTSVHFCRCASFSSPLCSSCRCSTDGIVDGQCTNGTITLQNKFSVITPLRTVLDGINPYLLSRIIVRNRNRSCRRIGERPDQNILIDIIDLPGLQQQRDSF